MTTDAEGLLAARKWLVRGGGGFEGGEDGIRAVRLSGESLVEYLAAYAAAREGRLRDLVKTWSERAHNQENIEVERCADELRAALGAPLREEEEKNEQGNKQ